MEGPGGYQLFGRTIQMWNRWRTTDCFEEGKPWLLRFFDQIRFFPVSGEELLEARAAFPHGAYPLRIEKGRFTLAEHERFLAANAAEITRAKRRQQSAFETERQRWRDFGLDSYIADDPGTAGVEGGEIFPDDITPVHAPSGASVWKIAVGPGDAVVEGQTLIIVETMKMEIQVTAPISGILRELRCQPGHTVKPGQILATIGAGA
jgi:urea carboxylase